MADETVHPPPPPNPPPPPAKPKKTAAERISEFRARMRMRGTHLGTASDGLGTWLLSIICCVALPCLPVVIDMLQAGHVTTNAYFITAAVLSVNYGVTAEHNVYRGIYLLTFVLALVLDAFGVANPSAAQHTSGAAASTGIVVTPYAPWLLLCVLSAHTAERFWWHVVWDQPFPDYLRKHQ